MKEVEQTDPIAGSKWSRRALLATAGAVAGGAGLSFTGATPPVAAATTTNDYFSVLSYGAVGNGTTNDTAAVQAAINAAQGHGGGTVYFPSGRYLLKGTGSELLLVQKQVRLLGDGARSVLYIDSSVPDTTDVIRLSPPLTGDGGFGWIVDSLQIMPVSGTPARHALVIDLRVAGQFMAKLLVQNNFFVQLGGRAIYLDNPTNADGLFTSAIENNFFHGGMSLLNAGDSINILGNTLTGRNCAIDISQISGARNVVIAFNNITASGGAVRWTPGTIGGGPGGQNKIMFNQIEQIGSNTGPENAMIAIVGTSNAIIGSTEIIGNNLDAHGDAANQVYLAYATYTKIRDNVIDSPSSFAIKIAATSDHTEIEYNNFLGSQTANALVEDMGIATLGVLRAVAPVNGWYNPDAATFGPVGVTKLSNGSIVCTGVLAGGSTSPGTTLFTLPAGFRPTFTHRYVVNGMTGAALTPAYVDVAPSGDVKVNGGGNTYLALDSIVFMAE